MKPLKILHVIPGLALSSGPTQVVMRLSEAQAKRGCLVTVFCLSGRLKAHEVALAGDVTLESFPVVGIRSWGYSSELRDRLQECLHTFDLVHLHSLWCYQNLIVRRLATRIGIPYIVRPAGSLEPWALSVSRVRKWLYYRLVEGGVLRDASALHAMSAKEAGTLSKVWKGPRVFTVPNGIDESPFDSDRDQNALRRDLGLPEDVPMVLFLGRLAPVKGLELIGDMMVALRKSLPEVQLVVAGPNQHAYAQGIRKLYDELGLNEAVRFVGEVSVEQGVLYYRTADVFVLPSLSENFGNVVLESMMAGTPPIVSEGVPWPELSEWKAGYWIPRTAESFASAALELLSDRRRCRDYGARAYRIAREYFGWDSVATRMEYEYAEVIS